MVSLLSAGLRLTGVLDSRSGRFHLIAEKERVIGMLDIGIGTYIYGDVRHRHTKPGRRMKLEDVPKRAKFEWMAAIGGPQTAADLIRCSGEQCAKSLYESLKLTYVHDVALKLG